MTTENRGHDAPWDRLPFSLQVDIWKSTMGTKIPLINSVALELLLACIREQQAALAAAVVTIEGLVDQQAIPDNWFAGSLLEIQSVLAKYALEK